MTKGDIFSLVVGLFALVVALFSAWPRLIYVWQTRSAPGKLQAAKKAVLRYRVLRRMRRDPGKLIGHVGVRFAAVASLTLLPLAMLMVALLTSVLSIQITVVAPDVVEYLRIGVEASSAERKASVFSALLIFTFLCASGVYFAGIISYYSIRTYRDITSIVKCRRQTEWKVAKLLGKARNAPVPAALEIDRGNPVPEVRRWKRRFFLFFV